MFPYKLLIILMLTVGQYQPILLMQNYNSQSLMVFHLPNENDLRSQVNYTYSFTLSLLWNVGLLNMTVTVLFIIFYLLKKYQLRIPKNDILKESILTSEERNSTERISIRYEQPKAEDSPVSVPINPQTTSFKIINFLTSFLFYCFWIVATFYYVVFFMFGYFGRGNNIDVLSVFVMTLAVVLPTLIWKYKTKVKALTEVREEITVTVILLVLWLGICVFLVIATKGGCVCYYTDKYGIQVQTDKMVSTDFTRLLNIDQVCKDQEVCHLYATLPEDGSTSVFLNAHAGISLQSLIFTLKLGNDVINIKNSSSPFKIDNVQSVGQRQVHSVLIQNLTANTTYSIQITNKNGVLLKSANYKTIPAADTQELKMAIGGDLGMNRNGEIMTSYLNDFAPDVIILGGDTVYDDGTRSCYYSWDNFYRMFEPVYEKLNRLIPIVLSVGNHDVGFDALSAATIQISHQAMPLFFVFNPQHSSHTGIDVPPVLQRDTVHYHKIGPTIHFHLDSGYVHEYKDQVHFIRSIAQSNPGLHRFANYHNPIFPSCTNSQPNSNDMQVIAAGLKYWTPVFDELGFVASMQHHTHYRKFSYKIKNGTNATSGTRYIGDGSWGVTEMTCSDQQVSPRINLLQHYANKNPNHMWQVVIRKNEGKPHTINYTAIDLAGKPVFTVAEDLPTLQ